jgi:hypothetical protein
VTKKPGFTFADYTAEELFDCGSAFQKSFATKRTAITTEDVLGWFYDSAPDGIRAYCKDRCVRGGYYEFLVDLCHTTYPSRDDAMSRCEWYRLASDRPLQFKLALESEWTYKIPPTDWRFDFHDWYFGLILDDAAKLAHVRAATKVMIFGSRSKEHRLQIVRALECLRRAADYVPWLWIDVPFEGKVATRDVQFAVIE